MNKEETQWWIEEDNCGYVNFAQGKYEFSKERLENAASGVWNKVKSQLNNLATNSSCRMVCYEATGEEDGEFVLIQESYIEILNMVVNGMEDIQKKYIHRYGIAQQWDDFRLGMLSDRITGLCEVPVRKTKRRRLSPTRSSDPFNVFPPEIASRVFGYLKTSDLAKASQVSQKWHNMVVSLSDFLTCPVFVDKIPISAMIKYIRTCERNHVLEPKCVSTGNSCYSQQLSFVKALSNSKVKVRALDFKGDYYPDTNLTSSKMESLRSISIQTELSEDIDFRLLLDFAPNLRRLSLRFDYEHTEFNMEFSSLKNLDELDISVKLPRPLTFGFQFDMFTFFTKHPLINIRKISLVGWLLNEPSLVSILTSGRPEMLTLGATLSIWDVANACRYTNTRLKGLHMSSMQLNSSPERPTDLSAFSHLKELGLDCTELTSEDVTAILDATNEGLTSLGLEGLASLDHEGLEQDRFSDILQRFPLLETLTISKADDAGSYRALGYALDSSLVSHLSKICLEDAEDKDVMAVFECQCTMRSVELVVGKHLDPETVTYLRDCDHCRRIRWETSSRR